MFDFKENIHSTRDIKAMNSQLIGYHISLKKSSCLQGDTS